MCVILMGLLFFVSFSHCSWLLYRNTTDFCMLILYLATLLNLFISSSTFLGESLGFSKYKNISSANKDNLTSSFIIWIPFITFSCLIALSRTSSTMLNNSGDRGHPCHVPDLRGKAFNFPSSDVVLAVVLLYMTFIMLRKIFAVPAASKDQLGPM
uniref:Uncharacterized protein n=1 Tax=Papio anubis TaxID=9555 RepID=A0A8I5N4R1_PAPAN